jgi:uncharacterized protein (DUF924 family)
MSNNKQSSIEWLYSNNETICEMLLLDKIPKSTYEQLINCFSMNLKQAKAMHKEEIIDSFGVGCQVEASRLIGYHEMAEQYYNETFNTKEK